MEATELEARRVAALERMAAAQEKQAETDEKKLALSERQLALNESEHEDRMLVLKGVSSVLSGTAQYLIAMRDSERQHQQRLAAHDAQVKELSAGTTE